MATLVKSFAAAPEPDDEELEEKALYKGWLPVDDEVNDVDDDPPRVTLESFIREVLRAR